ncbi:MAG: hypothetical protein ACOY90_01920 [Candidatus Zhuqueibacterota bacterium]
MNRPRFSEETILSVSKTTLTSARNNLTALAEFGITNVMLDQFDAQIQAAEALSGETQNRVELGDLTNDKEEALDACYQWGRKLRVRLQLAFGKNSSQASSFPSKDFQNAVNSENIMMTVMEVLISLAEKYKAELANFGQTPEILAQGSEFLNNLRQTDSVQEVKKDVKRQATQDRYQQFKNLYDTIIKINRVGRILFENDPVHLALFESKWPSPGAAPAEQSGNQ